jgi:hypothetical protein
MDNVYEPFNVTVELNYRVALRVYGQMTMVFSTSASTKTFSIVRPPHFDPEDDEGFDFVIEPYCNFQGVKQMLEVIDSGNMFLPFDGVTLIACTIASTMVFVCAASIESYVFKRRLNLRKIKYFLSSALTA